MKAIYFFEDLFDFMFHTSLEITASVIGLTFVIIFYVFSSSSMVFDTSVDVKAETKVEQKVEFFGYKAERFNAITKHMQEENELLKKYQ